MKPITVELGTVSFSCRPENLEETIHDVFTMMNSCIGGLVGRWDTAKELFDLRDGKVELDYNARIPLGTVTLFSEDFAHQVHSLLFNAELHQKDNSFALRLSDDFLKAANSAYDEILSVKRSTAPKCTTNPMIRQQH